MPRTSSENRTNSCCAWGWRPNRCRHLAGDRAEMHRHEPGRPEGFQPCRSSTVSGSASYGERRSGHPPRSKTISVYCVRPGEDASGPTSRIDPRPHRAMRWPVGTPVPAASSRKGGLMMNLEAGSYFSGDPDDLTNQKHTGQLFGEMRASANWIGCTFHRLSKAQFKKG